MSDSPRALTSLTHHPSCPWTCGCASVWTSFKLFTQAISIISELMSRRVPLASTSPSPHHPPHSLPSASFLLPHGRRRRHPRAREHSLRPLSTRFSRARSPRIPPSRRCRSSSLQPHPHIRPTPHAWQWLRRKARQVRLRAREGSWRKDSPNLLLCPALPQQE